MPSPYALPTLPSLPGTDIVRQPVDAFKIAVAQLVSEAWGDVDAAKLVAGVDTGKRGTDLTLAIPRFKKGKPDEWSQKVIDAVSV